MVGVDRGAGPRRPAEAGATIVVSDLAELVPREAPHERPRRRARTRSTAAGSRSTRGRWSRPATGPTTSGVTETLFTVANGYLGMRGNPEEGRPSYAHGTFLNGFHETWPIRHAEAAFGFARTGQTIVNVPDTKVMKIYVDDEPLTFGTADLEHYERCLDFRDGVLRRNLVWRTPSGKRVRIDSTRMVSMTQRHLAIMTLEVEMLTGDAPIVISSQILNRQDGIDEYRLPTTAARDRPGRPAQGGGLRRAGAAAADELRHRRPDDARLPVRALRHDDRGRGRPRAARPATSSRSSPVPRTTWPRWSSGSTRPRARTMRLQKTVAYHSSRGVPVRELSDRCDRTLDRAARHGLRALRRRPARRGTPTSGRPPTSRSSATTRSPAVQQAIRFNLFSWPRRPPGSTGSGVPAKGMTGSGYEGHYFWDTEVYVVPFLSYTQPEVARNALHFRSRDAAAARERAREMAQSGALFPWRTINGEEASAYYAAGTAQVHIDADIAYALMKYVRATGDDGFLVREGIDILVETARMWADLGLLAQQRRRRPSTSTASPGRTSTRPSSTTTSSPT